MEVIFLKDGLLCVCRGMDWLSEGVGCVFIRGKGRCLLGLAKWLHAS